MTRHLCRCTALSVALMCHGSALDSTSPPELRGAALVVIPFAAQEVTLHCLDTLGYMLGRQSPQFRAKHGNLVAIYWEMVKDDSVYSWATAYLLKSMLASKSPKDLDRLLPIAIGLNDYFGDLLLEHIIHSNSSYETRYLALKELKKRVREGPVPGNRPAINGAWPSLEGS